MGRYKKGHLTWVVFTSDPGKSESHYLCERCGQTRAIKMPAQAKKLLVITNAFLTLHADCLEGVPVQATLPLKEE
jgi:hypothetical protein